MQMSDGIRLYQSVLSAQGFSELARQVNIHKHDLSESMVSNPDFHPDATRNGVVQPMMLTRGGNQHTYNVICVPGDQLCAGDLIEVFGEKLLVMEARPDATTHMTGVAMICNHLFKFQNFTSEVIERWGIIDQSGYSSTVKGSNQVQTSEEQVAIYLPCDADTEKIYVGKRLASHTGYESSGKQILNSYEITSCSPNTRSFNTCDHLLMLKAIRSVYSPSADNLTLQICDYIQPPAASTDEPATEKLRCAITGRTSIRIGRSVTYKPVFYDADDTTVIETPTPVWSYDEVSNIVFETTDGDLKVSIGNVDSLIGSTFTITLTDSEDTYEPIELTVEVINIA